MNNKKHKLPNVKVGLYDNCGNCVAMGITNNCGEAIFDNLPLGEYFVQTMDCVEGYQQIGNQGQSVKLTNCDNCGTADFCSAMQLGSIKVTQWGIINGSNCREEWGSTTCEPCAKDNTSSGCGCNTNNNQGNRCHCGKCNAR